MPPFFRRHDNPTLRYVTEYDDVFNVTSEMVVPAVEAEGLPEDSQLGSGIVESKLARLLS